MPTLALLFAVAGATSPPADPATIAAIEATCHDYVDGQLEADPQRVTRSLHPDLAKRAVLGDPPDERLGLRRMSREELVALTKQGAEDAEGAMGPPLHGAGRDRQCRLGAAGNAVVRRLLPHGPFRPALGHRQRAVVPETEGAVERCVLPAKHGSPSSYWSPPSRCCPACSTCSGWPGWMVGRSRQTVRPAAWRHAAVNRAGYQRMNPWGFVAQLFDQDAGKANVPVVEQEAYWVARRHLMRQPRHGMLRW